MSRDKRREYFGPGPSYFERHGPTPLDAVPERERAEHAAAIQHAAIVRLLLEHHGGRVVVSGVGSPEAIGPLLERRIALRGLGDGRIEVRVVE